MEPLLLPLAGHSMAVIDGGLVVAGGQSLIAGTPQKTVFKVRQDVACFH